MTDIKMILKKYVLLIFIIAVSSVLRLWQLGAVPPSPDWDEASLGYNAYSILKTGRDEYGSYLPLTLRSFDDYKPPLYMYLTVPSVAVFGLNTWSVRLPSAIAGILAVVGTYFFVRELFRSSLVAYHLSLITSFLLAISPWHIQFSRIAFEANIGVTLNIWALVAFFCGIKSRRWLSVSAFLFGLGFYAYHSERIFVPLLVLLLIILFRRTLLPHKRAVVIALMTGFITIAPLIPVFFDSTTLTRLRGTSALADQTVILAQSVKRLENDQSRGDVLGLIVDNRRVVWAKKLLEGYAAHFSLRWMFLTGDNPRHHAPDVGLLYLVELPFFLLGLIFIGRRYKRKALLVYGWLLIAPVAASPTTELPHAIRTLVFLPALQLVTAVGIYEAILFLKVKYTKYFHIFVYLFICLFFVNVYYYIHMYFVHMNLEFSKSWQYGYKQAVDYAQEHKKLYKKIIVSTKLEQPHMFFLFYSKYDPEKYLSQGGTVSGGFAETYNRFDVYEFRPIQWDREIHDGTILYIGTPGEIPSSPILTIPYMDGSAAMVISQ